MTVLTACIDSAVELSQPQPSSLFSSTDKFAKELALQANRSALALAKRHDWQKLKTLNTITGDGTTTSWSLPSDYDRMPVKANLLSSDFAAPLTLARDEDEWLDLQIRGIVGTPGVWIILGGSLQIMPALASGTTVKFYYIRNTIVTGSDGTLKTAFTDDADTFVLSEQMLSRDVVWRWRASKRMEYAEDMTNAEIFTSQEVTRDKGSRVIAVGRARIPSDVEVAYPSYVVP